MDEKKLEAVAMRKVVKIRGSCYICIPANFVRHHGIQPGDRLAIVMGENMKVTLMEK